MNSAPRKSPNEMAYEIQLSFLPLHNPLPLLPVFRRERAPDEKSPADDVHGFWLRSG